MFSIIRHLVSIALICATGNLAVGQTGASKTQSTAKNAQDWHAAITGDFRYQDSEASSAKKAPPAPNPHPPKRLPPDVILTPPPRTEGTSHQIGTEGRTSQPRNDQKDHAGEKATLMAPFEVRASKLSKLQRRQADRIIEGLKVLNRKIRLEQKDTHTTALDRFLNPAWLTFFGGMTAQARAAQAQRRIDALELERLELLHALYLVQGNLRTPGDAAVQDK